MSYKTADIMNCQAINSARCWSPGQDSTKPHWFLYLIRTASGSLYCGVTTNVERRFREHEANGKKSARYLRGKGPLTLVFYTAVGNRSRALTLERRVKRLSKAQKERIVQTQCLPGSLLV